MKSNLAGCILHVTKPIRVRCARRLLDAAAHLRLAMGRVSHCESRDDARPLAQWFAARRAYLRSDHPASVLNEDGHPAWVGNLLTRHGARHALAVTVAP